MTPCLLPCAPLCSFSGVRWLRDIVSSPSSSLPLFSSARLPLASPRIPPLHNLWLLLLCLCVSSLVSATTKVPRFPSGTSVPLHGVSPASPLCPPFALRSAPPSFLSFPSARSLHPLRHCRGPHFSAMAAFSATTAAPLASAPGGFFCRPRSTLKHWSFLSECLGASISSSFLALPLLRASRKTEFASSLSSLASSALPQGPVGVRDTPHLPGVRTPELRVARRQAVRSCPQSHFVAHLSASAFRDGARTRRGLLPSQLSASSVVSRHCVGGTEASAPGCLDTRGDCMQRASQALQKRFIFFDSCRVQIPHPAKREKGGEDAAACSDRFLVVADGVGGWESSGIDAGRYARELVHRLRLLFEECMRDRQRERQAPVSSASPSSCSASSESPSVSPSSPLSPPTSPRECGAESGGLGEFQQSGGEQITETAETSASEGTEEEHAPDPVKLLKTAYLSTRAIGSTTCCLVLLDSLRRRVLAANLGDSGFFLYRPSEDRVVARSAFQCHDFNFPLQLGTGSSDMPEHAHVLDLPVAEGDILFLATDGVWDNLYDDQVLAILRNQPDVRKAAAEIAELAFKYSQNPRWASPFSTKEREVLGLTRRHLGGKPDDISVVLATVVRKKREFTPSDETH
ncbi:UNVERIFIED_CONTAM: protein phosphatase 2C, putative [Hammondia hammondi]|eukprot:XP_008885062.1 protein phosphatase 2C, putative [Hammondia hammondi]